MTCPLYAAQGLPPVGGTWQYITLNSASEALGSSATGSRQSSQRSRSPEQKASQKASNLAKALFEPLYESFDAANALAEACSEDVVWEDLTEARSAHAQGKEGVLLKLAKRVKAAPAGTRLVLDDVADGVSSGGFLWHLENDSAPGVGLRGSLFFELDSQGKIALVREATEPLFKPGGSTAELLRSVTAKVRYRISALRCLLLPRFSFMLSFFICHLSFVISYFVQSLFLANSLCLVLFLLLHEFRLWTIL